MRIKVCAASELAEESVKVFDQDGVEGLVVRSGETLYACQRYCTHELFPLEFGQLSAPGVLRCTLHGSEFKLQTGETLGPPADSGLTIYTVTVEDGNIVVEVPDQ